jgi:hypothetical protein
LSKDPTVEVSRNEEIRAIFIFGLLAVFAYVKIQYPTLKIGYPYGTINLIPLIDIVIILWSLYAFFMVLGLSKDAIGKSATVFRFNATFFLQYSFIILGFFGVLFGFLIYGVRLILLLFMIASTVIIGLFFHFIKRTKPSNERLSFKDFKEFLSKIKNYRSFISGLVLLSSVTIVLYYPNNWFGSTAVIISFFGVAVVCVGLILIFQNNKTDKSMDEYNI